MTPRLKRCPRCGGAPASHDDIAWHVENCLGDMTTHEALHAIFHTACTETEAPENMD